MKPETTMLTKANGITLGDGSTQDRELKHPTPRVLLTENLQELLETLGDDAEMIVFKKAVGQLTVDFRAVIRGQMTSVDKETGQFANDDASILDGLENWVPKLRQVRSREEKIADDLANLTPEQIAEVLAQAGIEM